ncbi:MAG: acetate--CoA ligase family protein [Betaproteobacteria bacterium]|nr:acetate--CoA ligase family protein [Betaproteobacteria bacterium]
MNPALAFPDLTHFFAPRSVALIGATEDSSKYAGRSMQLMLDFGFRGQVYPVNPKYRQVRGFDCYPSVRDLPEAPDHVSVVVPAERVLGVLEDCAARGAKFATVLTSGFAETGTERGRELQAQLGEFARRTGMRLMGPNCNGIVNFVDRFALSYTATLQGPPHPREPGNIGVVSQSGGLGLVSAMWRAQDAGLGINYAVTCGNDADLDALDFARYMVCDPKTDVVLMIAERISNGEKLRVLANLAAEREKPIVLVKLGRTEAGSRAAQSHTGAVTGSDAVHDCAFRQFGLIRVDDCNELYEVAMLLRNRRFPRGPRAASMSVSGGNVVLVTDLGAANGIEWPAFTQETQANLAELMPSFGRVSNPTDLTTAGILNPDMFGRVLEAAAADVNVDIMVPIVTFGTSADIHRIADLARSSAKPFALLWNGACIDCPELMPRDVVKTGVAVYRDVHDCMKAVRAAVDYGRFLDAFKHRSERPAARPPGIDAEAAEALLGEHATGTLSELVSKSMLNAYGLATTDEAIAKDANEAAAIANRLGGALALKICSADIPHKTEAGAIRLNVAGEAAVRRAYEEVVAAARAFKPDARADGVLVSRMAPRGIELMLGFTHDPVFGPVVVAGIGGIHVEVLRDLAYRIAPVDRMQAAAMLKELKAFALLQGVRGQPPRDIEALIDAIVRVSWLAVDLRDDIAELDINPLVALEQGRGALVVDALIVKRKP